MHTSNPSKWKLRQEKHESGPSLGHLVSSSGLYKETGISNKVLVSC